MGEQRGLKPESSRVHSSDSSRKGDSQPTPPLHSHPACKTLIKGKMDRFNLYGRGGQLCMGCWGGARSGLSVPSTQTCAHTRTHAQPGARSHASIHVRVPLTRCRRHSPTQISLVVSSREGSKRDWRSPHPPCSLSYTHTQREGRGEVGKRGQRKEKLFFFLWGGGNNEDGCVAVMNFSSGPKCNCNAWISASGRGLAVAVGFFFCRY